MLCISLFDNLLLDTITNADDEISDKVERRNSKKEKKHFFPTNAIQRNSVFFLIYKVFSFTTLFLPSFLLHYNPFNILV